MSAAELTGDVWFQTAGESIRGRDDIWHVQHSLTIGRRDSERDLETRPWRALAERDGCGWAIDAHFRHWIDDDSRCSCALTPAACRASCHHQLKGEVTWGPLVGQLWAGVGDLGWGRHYRWALAAKAWQRGQVVSM
jgi:hypothetical protein